MRLPVTAVLVALLLSGWHSAVAASESSAPVAPPPAAAQRPLSLIPEPAKLDLRDGRFVLTRDTGLVCPPSDSACSWTANWFAQLVLRTRGMALSRSGRSAAGSIVFKREHGSANPESYSLDVGPGGIRISASTDAGLLYGAVTLWQLASLEQGDAKEIEIPALHIEDRPRFAWRGVLLDSARHFQPPAFVKAFIDAMALHKLNVLQWHLTDDQGWRVEIRKYPRLTRIGAWRPDGKGGRHGGFYSQAEIRDIVAYAHRRNVTIVPEIEMPGHALAAIVAYPGLGSVRHPPRTVSSDWGVFPYLYNTSDATFRFLDNVLSEVMAMFPGRYIHIGGDEAVKDQWNASPRIRAQMRRLHIKDAEALQAWFVDRIGRFLSAHGRRLMGWDEILNAGLSPDAAITSWRTLESAAEASKLGHDVVLSPSPILYFDFCQVMREGEPPCRGMETTLKQVYDLAPAADPHIIGVQGNLWTERLDTDARVDYAAFPRAAALAELGWTPAPQRDWHSFLERMPAEFARYRALGITHSESAFTVEIAAAASGNGARVSMSNQVGYGEIRYSLDANADSPADDPSAASQRYQAPFDTALPAKITATAFVDGKPVGKSTVRWLEPWSLLRRSSFDMDQCTDDLPLAVSTSGVVSMVNVMNPCWIYRKLDLSGITAVDVEIADFPFNYQIGNDIAKIPLYPEAPPQGALQVRLDGCDGNVIASMTLPAQSEPVVATDQVRIAPQQGVHDLCFRFERRSVDPVWTLIHVIPVRHASE